MVTSRLSNKQIFFDDILSVQEFSDRKQYVELKMRERINRVRDVANVIFHGCAD